VWNAIGLIGYKRNQDSTLPAGQQIDERSWIASAQVNAHPTSEWDIAGRYAVKYARDASNGLTSIGLTQLLGARATRDIGERWDVGVQGYTSWGLGARQKALGLEMGYLIRRNLWFSLGYNFVGFSEADLAGDAYTQRGIFLRMRFKFGADLFEQAGDAQALPVSPANAAASMWSTQGIGGVSHGH
jgi:hypothetical protein